MSNPTFPERMDRIEDEVAALESMVDARTRKLWSEIQKLAAVVEQLNQAHDSAVEE